jgi:hypothetical protein
MSAAGIGGNRWLIMAINCDWYLHHSAVIINEETMKMKKGEKPSAGAQTRTRNVLLLA